MGALDTWGGDAPCPTCGMRYHLHGQTKFLEPDFGGLHSRDLRPGQPQPLDLDPDAFLDPVHDEWFRVRAPTRSDRLDLLLDSDEWFACSCDTALAPVLRLALRPDEVELLAVELREVDGPDLVDVDFAPGEYAVEAGPLQTFWTRLAALAALPLEARRDRVRSLGTRRFPEGWREADGGLFTTISAPVRCAACGEQRPRRIGLPLNHPHDFGAPWILRGHTGPVRLGERVDDDGLWQADRDRHWWLRTRPPGGPDELVLLGPPLHASCRCGAGPLRPRLVWVATRGALALAEVTLVPEPDRTALDHVDFVWAPRRVRVPPDRGA